MKHDCKALISTMKYEIMLPLMYLLKLFQCMSLNV